MLLPPLPPIVRAATSSVYSTGDGTHKGLCSHLVTGIHVHFWCLYTFHVSCIKLCKPKCAYCLPCQLRSIDQSCMSPKPDFKPFLHEMWMARSITFWVHLLLRVRLHLLQGAAQDAIGLATCKWDPRDIWRILNNEKWFPRSSQHGYHVRVFISNTVYRVDYDSSKAVSKLSL